MIDSTHSEKEAKVDISVVIPVFNEEGNIEKVCHEIINVLSPLGIAYEIIFADDGSRDHTWEIIESFNKDHPFIMGVRLSRNFGHQCALWAGLKFSRGSAVITMDGDMQHPPSLLPQLIDEWKNGAQIVNTIRIDLKELSFFKKFTSKFYYRLFSFLSGVNLEAGMSDFRLLDRKVLDNVLSFSETDLFLRAIVQWVGYTQVNIPFMCNPRFSGRSKYTIVKMAKLAFAGITSFSIIPLRMAILIGLISSAISFYQMGYALYAKILLKATVPGWATTITIMTFMFGVLFILLGILGEYIGRILIQTKNRPKFLIRERKGFTKSI